MGVITKPSSVQRSVIVRLLVACGMAAGCGGAHAQRSPRGAVYRRRGLLPRAQHALLTQTVHKKRAISTRSPQKKCRSIYETVVKTPGLSSPCKMKRCQGLLTAFGLDFAPHVYSGSQLSLLQQNSILYYRCSGLLLEI